MAIQNVLLITTFEGLPDQADLINDYIAAIQGGNGQNLKIGECFFFVQGENLYTCNNITFSTWEDTD